MVVYASWPLNLSDYYYILLEFVLCFIKVAVLVFKALQFDVKCSPIISDLLLIDQTDKIKMYVDYIMNKGQNIL